MSSPRYWLMPLWQLWWTKILEWSRDGLVVFLLAPILVVGGLGIAFNRDGAGAELKVAVVGAPGQTEPLAAELARTEGLVPVPLERAEAERQLQRGKVALLVIAEDPPELVIDPTHPEHRYARLAVKDAIERARGRSDLVAFRESTAAQPGQRYVDFLVPGFLAFMLLNVAQGVGSNLVEDRQRNLLKRLAASPMQRWQYLTAHGLKQVFIAALTFPIYALASWLMFKVEVRGSILLLMGFTIFGTLMLSTIGCLLGSRAVRSEETHNLFTLVSLPQTFLCGVFFSVEHFPEWLIPIVRLLPLTAFADGLRAIMNDGATLLGVLQPTLILLAWGVPSLLVSLRIFRWQ